MLHNLEYGIDRIDLFAVVVDPLNLLFLIVASSHDLG